MSTHYKCDYEILKEAVKDVKSWRALALKLGLPYPSSVIYYKVRRFCRAQQIDTSHFTGKAWNRGKKHPELRQDIQKYFRNEIFINSHALKLRLIEEGLKEHRCEVCGLTEWNSKPIPIQLHHKDGNGENNAFENLEIDCPNCHAQTSTYCAKNCKSHGNYYRVPDADILKAIPLCYSITQVLRQLNISTGQGNYDRIRKLMSTNLFIQFKTPIAWTKKYKNPNADPLWRVRPKPHKRKFIRPSSEELRKLVWEKPSLQIAKDFGCADNLINKWCKWYGIDKPPRGYWAKRAVGQTHEQALEV